MPSLSVISEMARNVRWSERLNPLVRLSVLFAGVVSASLAFAADARAQQPSRAPRLFGPIEAEIETPVDPWSGLASWLFERRLHVAGRDQGEAIRLDEPTLFPADASEQEAAPGCDLVLGGGKDLERWERDLWIGAPWSAAIATGHTDKAGRWIDYDQIPRRWDRPEAYAAYRYPVPSALVVSGYDLDRPDELQRRGTMTAVGHGGVDLVETKGTPIAMLALDNQIGDAEVIFVGPLFGETVITRHTRREGGKPRDYVLLFGHLEKAAEGVRRGRRLRVGETVGFVGDTMSPELVHLHLEARRMRDGVDAWKSAWNITAREASVVCDPRNVLPLRAPKRRMASCAPRLFHERPKLLAKPLTLALDEDAIRAFNTPLRFR